MPPQFPNPSSPVHRLFGPSTCIQQTQIRGQQSERQGCQDMRRWIGGRRKWPLFMACSQLPRAAGFAGAAGSFLSLKLCGMQRRNGAGRLGNQATGSGRRCEQLLGQQKRSLWGDACWFTGVGCLGATSRVASSYKEGRAWWLFHEGKDQNCGIACVASRMVVMQML